MEDNDVAFASRHITREPAPCPHGSWELAPRQLIRRLLGPLRGPAGHRVTPAPLIGFPASR